MLPHSYTIDSYSKSQDLAAEILAASSPLQISAACDSLHSFLRHVSPDQSRWFFSVAFPTLIAKLFGFDDSSNQASSGGWIDAILVANDADLAGKVFGLLSPDGALMGLITAVDRLSLVKYMFPTERLPEWVRYILSSEHSSKVVQEICPLFRDKVKEDVSKGSEFQVQLNVFDYYMFWFAYYPVCRGKNESVRNATVQKVSKFGLKNWASSLPVFSSYRRGAESKTECNLYMWLLYGYLCKFVPAYDMNLHKPYRSSIRHYPSNYDGSVVMQAEFVVGTFVHFWLVDNDFSPLSVNVCKSSGLSFPLRSVLSEMPPISGLGELVKLFVKYVNMSFVVAAEGSGLVEYTDSPRWKALSAPFDGPKLTDVSLVHTGATSPTFNVMIKRPLYRFILRTFLFCPMETSIKNISEVFSVWITYIEPWKMSSDEFAEFDALMDGSLKNNKAQEKQPLVASEYSSGWSDYVISNYLFYSSLVMHFIGFAHKFLHADPETIVQMMLKVMSVLTASKEMTELIKKMDAVFHSKALGPGKSTLSSLYKYVPAIHEQLQDWEDGLCESDADGSFLHDNWNRDLRLFSDGEDGGQQLLQLFILRAEYELQAISGDSSNGIKCIDSLKSQISCIFGSHVASPKCGTPAGKDGIHETTTYDRHDLFTPRKVGKTRIGDVRYKGDWMRRPASGDEIAWLADLLVRLSAWLNENLGLNRGARQTGGGGSSLNISNVSENKVYGTNDAVKMVVLSVGSWLMMLGLGVVDLMRKHGFRINLRFLASKKVLAIGFVILVLIVLCKCFGLA